MLQLPGKPCIDFNCCWLLLSLLMRLTMFSQSHCSLLLFVLKYPQSLVWAVSSTEQWLSVRPAISWTYGKRQATRLEQERTCLIQHFTFVQTLIIYNELHIAPFHKDHGDKYFRSWPSNYRVFLKIYKLKLYFVYLMSNQRLSISFQLISSEK